MALHAMHNWQSSATARLEEIQGKKRPVDSPTALPNATDWTECRPNLWCRLVNADVCLGVRLEEGYTLAALFDARTITKLPGQPTHTIVGTWSVAWRYLQLGRMGAEYKTIDGLGHLKESARKAWRFEPFGGPNPCGTGKVANFNRKNTLASHRKLVLGDLRAVDGLVDTKDLVTELSGREDWTQDDYKRIATLITALEATEAH